MHTALYIAAALAALSLVGFVCFRLGRAQAVRDATWQVDRLAERWKRERREPPQSRANLVLMRGSRQ